MRVYIEAMEIVEGDEEFTEELDFVRIDVTEKTEQEREEIIQAIREQFAGKKYLLQLHICRHDEGEACSVSVIEEVR